MKKKCLAVVYEQLDKDGRAQRQVETLVKGGYSVTIICANTLPSIIIPECQIVNFSTGRKLQGWLKFNLLVFTYILKHRRDIDFLYLLNSYMLILGFAVKILLGIKWVYDSYENLIIAPKYKSSKIDKVIYLLERSLINKASLVVAANYERARILSSIYKIENVTYVMNIIHKNSFFTTLKTPSYNRSEDFWILYQGAITKERNLSLFISSLQYLPNNFKLKIIGSGDDESLREMVRILNLSGRVFFEGRLSYEEMLKKSIGCHLGIVYYLSWNLNTYYCSPNKIFEYTNMQIPIISSSQYLFQKIFFKFKIGSFLKDDATPFDVAKKIEDISLNYNSYISDFNSFNKEYNSDKEEERLLVKLKSTF